MTGQTGCPLIKSIVVVPICVLPEYCVRVPLRCPLLAKPTDPLLEVTLPPELTVNDAEPLVEPLFVTAPETEPVFPVVTSVTLPLTVPSEATVIITFPVCVVPEFVKTKVPV